MEWDWKRFYDKAYDWLISNGPKVFFGIIVLLIGMWLVRRINKWLRKRLEEKKFNPSLRYFFLNLVAISLQILLVVVVLQIAGIQLTFLTALIAALGVAAGLALSGTLQNFVSGILILLLRPYAVGDYVIMQGQEGRVTSIQLFHTFILTADNKTIIVPNGQLSNNIVINLSKEGKRRMDISLKFGYNISINDIKIIVNSLVNEADILREPPHSVVVTSLEGDKFSVDIQVWVRIDNYDKAKFLLHEKLITKFKETGVITVPQ
jgi:small conductance mechanosensitive channel